MRQLFLVIAVSISTQLQAGTFEDANKLITDKNYPEAIAMLEPYVDSVNDLAALYNLGIAYHQNGYHGKAIWAFEKILKQDPKDDKSVDQVLACTKDLDEHAVWTPINGNLASSIYSLSSGTWSILAIFFSIISSLLLYYWISRKDEKTRMLAVGFIICFMAFIGAIIAAYFSRDHETSTYCIAVKESNQHQLKNDGYEKTEMIILEGSRLLLLNEIDSTYFEVENPDHEQFLVLQSDFRTI